MRSDEKRSPGNGDGDERLWDLLGKARKVEPSPMFARDLSRKIRLLEDEKRGRGGILRFPRPSFSLPTVAFSAAALVAILLLVSVLYSPPEPNGPEMAVTPDASSPALLDPADELESIEYFGELMAVADPATLSDEALLDLLY